MKIKLLSVYNMFINDGRGAQLLSTCTILRLKIFDYGQGRQELPAEHLREQWAELTDSDSGPYQAGFPNGPTDFRSEEIKREPDSVAFT
ncbi:hypothetical protein GCM10027051_16670 [Niabella terrae]